MANGYFFITLGCKVNSYESEGMALILDKLGYHLVQKDEDPEVVVVNTCTVTSVSDKKSRQMIHRAIKNYSNAIICAVGCYSQLEADSLKEDKRVNIILGTNNRNKIGEYILEYKKNKNQIVDVSESRKNHQFDGLNVTSFHENTRAFLKVQDGCNNFCSYCIVPYARGPMRSRDKNDILKEAQELVNKGFQELVLTGIHTAGYGIDLENYHFVDLLKDLLSNVKGIKRLRISSIEASEINDEIINLLKNSDIIVNHLHIPLQSGCKEIIKRMNRKYTLNEYENTIKKIREAKKDISITTDVIVGFPGETEEEFSETIEFIKKIGFAQLHVFPYSRREGTVADKMEGQVDPKTKKDRVKELIKISNILSKQYAKQFENKVVDVLFETFDEATSTLEGHTTNYLKVKVNGKKEYINKIISVRIINSGFPINIGEIEEG